MQEKPKLSIVILNRNTKKLLEDCIESLKKVYAELNFEVIVVDNGSSQESVDYIKNLEVSGFEVKKVFNSENLGFAAGNNKARKLCSGEFILFLNSDTIVYPGTLRESLEYIEINKNIGALTCKIVLPDGSLDKDARRSFINPWNSLVHLYLRLDRVFPKSKIFSTYWYGYFDENLIHEVDVIQGAFFLTRKKVLDEVEWFDEDYFLDGEDIDLCWKIKQKGWNIIYYPKVKIMHLKGATKGKNREYIKNVSLKEKLKYRLTGVNSMELFLKKRLWEKYPLALNLTVLSGIYLLKFIRVIKTVLLG